MSQKTIRACKELRYMVLNSANLSVRNVGVLSIQSALRFVISMWFLEFCVSHNILAPFITNVQRCVDSPNLRTDEFDKVLECLQDESNSKEAEIWGLMDTCLKRYGNNPNQILIWTFLWRETDEGWRFWSKMADEMQDDWKEVFKTQHINPAIAFDERFFDPIFKSVLKNIHLLYSNGEEKKKDTPTHKFGLFKYFPYICNILKSKVDKHILKRK